MRFDWDDYHIKRNKMGKDEREVNGESSGDGLFKNKIWWRVGRAIWKGRYAVESVGRIEETVVDGG